jgi:hypothetical protein
MQEKVVKEIKTCIQHSFIERKAEHEWNMELAKGVTDNYNESEINKLIGEPKLFFDEDPLETDFMPIKYQILHNMEPDSLEAIKRGEDIYTIVRYDRYTSRIIKHYVNGLMLDHIKKLIGKKGYHPSDLSSYLDNSKLTLLRNIKIELNKHGYIDKFKQPRNAKEIKWLYWLLTHDKKDPEGFPDYGAKKIIDPEVWPKKNVAIAFCKFFECVDKWDSVNRYYKNTKYPQSGNDDFLELRTLIKETMPKK